MNYNIIHTTLYNNKTAIMLFVIVIFQISKHLPGNFVIVVETLSLKSQGDILLGGLFPIHTKGTDTIPCGRINVERGVQRFIAMLYAIELINNDTSILPGIKLGVNILDTCARENYALNQSLEFVRVKMSLVDSRLADKPDDSTVNSAILHQTTNYTTKSHSNFKSDSNKSLKSTYVDNDDDYDGVGTIECSDGSIPYYKKPPTPVLGVVGGSYSGVSIQVANLLRLFKIPQVSYASTSSVLSDKSRYDYFARTVPPDQYQARAMVDIAVRLGWTYVSTVASQGDYGESGIDSFNAEARKKHICIAVSEKIPMNARASHFDGILKNLNEKPNARVIILFLKIEDATDLMKAVKRSPYKNDFVWISGDGWGREEIVVRGQEEAAQGAITIELQSHWIRDFDKYFKQLHPNNFKSPDRIWSRGSLWLKEFWEQEFNCKLDLDRPYYSNNLSIPTTVVKSSPKIKRDIMISLNRKDDFIEKNYFSHMTNDEGNFSHLKIYNYSSTPLFGKQFMQEQGLLRLKKFLKQLYIYFYFYNSPKHNNTKYNNYNLKDSFSKLSLLNDKINCDEKICTTTSNNIHKKDIFYSTNKRLRKRNKRISNHENNDNNKSFKAKNLIQLNPAKIMKSKVDSDTEIAGFTSPLSSASSIPTKTNSLPACDWNRVIDDSNYKQEGKTQFIIDAVFAVAHALHRFQQDKCHKKQGACPELKKMDGGDFFRNYIINMSFTNFIGEKIRLDHLGDGIPRYNILNYRFNPDTGAYEYKVVGIWDEGLDLYVDKIRWKTGLVMNGAGEDHIYPLKTRLHTSSASTAFSSSKIIPTSLPPLLATTTILLSPKDNISINTKDPSSSYLAESLKKLNFAHEILIDSSVLQSPNQSSVLNNEEVFAPAVDYESADEIDASYLNPLLNLNYNHQISSSRNYKSSSDATLIKPSHFPESPSLTDIKGINVWGRNNPHNQHYYSHLITKKLRKRLVLLSRSHSRTASNNDTVKVRIPVSRCSEPCKRGQIKNMQKGDICCWICTKCQPWEYVGNETACWDCGIGRWPKSPDLDSCFKLPVRYILWNSMYAIIPVCISLVGFLVTMYVGLIFFIHIDTPLVKASGRELSFMLLGGILTCYLCTFPLLAKPTILVCGMQRFMIGFGFAVMYSSLLTKTNRISRIFNNANRSAKRPKFISPMSQLVIALILIGVQVFLNAVWFLLETPGTRKFSPENKRDIVILKCRIKDTSFLISLAYNIILIIVCTVYAVKTRKIPENFNESKFIGFSMYTTCIIWLAFIPIYFSTLNEFQIQTTTLCITISLSATVTLLCLFGPKIYIIVFHPEKNVRKLTMGSGGYIKTATNSSSTYNHELYSSACAASFLGTTTISSLYSKNQLGNMEMKNGGKVSLTHHNSLSATVKDRKSFNSEEENLLSIEREMKQITSGGDSTTSYDNNAIKSENSKSPHQFDFDEQPIDLSIPRTPSKFKSIISLDNNISKLDQSGQAINDEQSRAMHHQQERQIIPKRVQIMNPSGSCSSTDLPKNNVSISVENDKKNSIKINKCRNNNYPSSVVYKNPGVTLNELQQQHEKMIFPNPKATIKKVVNVEDEKRTNLKKPKVTKPTVKRACIVEESLTSF